MLRRKKNDKAKIQMGCIQEGDRIYSECLVKHNGNKPAALCCYNGAELENGSCEYAEKAGER
jgi:hypothetical protein